MNYFKTYHFFVLNENCNVNRKRLSKIRSIFVYIGILLQKVLAMYRFFILIIAFTLKNLPNILKFLSILPIS